VRGDCASCGFPIRLKDRNAIACPFCSTVNTPISAGFAVSPILVGLVVVGAILVISKGKARK
jgi:hypothetical protein